MSSQLSLNLRCLARSPVIRFDNQLMADINFVRQQYTLPLLVHIFASERLRQDVKFFVSQGPYNQDGVVAQFGVSVGHHLEILLKPTLKMFCEGLRGYRGIKASEKFLDGKVPTIGDLLDQMEDSLSGLEDAWEYVKEITSVHLPILPGSIVPTASPSELLITLLVNRPSFLQKIAIEGDTVLGNIGKYLGLPSTFQIPNNLRKTMPPKRVADGSPKMFFACYHTSNGIRRLFVGASQENWTGLPEIGNIRRADRDERLRFYIPYTVTAYNALHHAEEGVVLPASDTNLKKKKKTYRIRTEAIGAIKTHPDFLGRVTEVGQAFDRTMKSRQCCYACKGMMGYRTPAQFDQSAVEENLCDSKWGDYTHACAEIGTSIQCSHHWYENGKSIKY
ncbi:MAG: hypothetical protein M1840_001796 [Geoglossum simile]|nr:MAG: hypothetical protein M1840_001796 [Geoglossum simile]